MIDSNNFLYGKTFGQVDSNDIDIVGGKGANLGEMFQAGFPVPPSFILTTESLDLFLCSSNNLEELYQKLDEIISTDLGSVRTIGKYIRDSFGKIEIPQTIINNVDLLITEFGANNYYVVQSSATAEDLPGASFAG